MYHVIMHEVPLENCIEPTDVKNLFVAPASLDLAGAEIELVPAFSRENRLQAGDRRRARRLRLRPDRLPAVARPAHRQRSRTRPARCWCRSSASTTRSRVSGSCCATSTSCSRNLNPELEVSTIVCVMYDARTKLADQVVNEVREHFGDKVLPHGRAAHGAAVRGAVVRPADHHVRSSIPRRRRLPGSRQGGAAMARRSGLGKGLGALIPAGEAAPRSATTTDRRLVEIPVGRSSSPTRTSRASTSTRSRWPSWRRRSARSACCSRSSCARSRERYQLIAGERRWRAARRAGLAAVPAVVRVTDDVELGRAGARREPPSRRT